MGEMADCLEGNGLDNPASLGMEPQVMLIHRD
jgi:hypothetical protein